MPGMVASTQEPGFFKRWWKTIGVILSGLYVCISEAGNVAGWISGSTQEDVRKSLLLFQERWEAIPLLGNHATIPRIACVGLLVVICLTWAAEKLSLKYSRRLPPQRRTRTLADAAKAFSEPLPIPVTGPPVKMPLPISQPEELSDETAALLQAAAQDKAKAAEQERKNAEAAAAHDSIVRTRDLMDQFLGAGRWAPQVAPSPEAQLSLPDAVSLLKEPLDMSNLITNENEGDEAAPGDGEPTSSSDSDAQTGDSDSRTVAIVHRKDEHYWCDLEGEFKGKISIENRTAFSILGVYAKITRLVPLKDKAKMMPVVDPIIGSRLEIDAERHHCNDITVVAIGPHEKAPAWVIYGHSMEPEIKVNTGGTPSLIPKGRYELTITLYRQDHGELDSMTFIIGQSKSGAVTFRPKGT